MKVMNKLGQSIEKEPAFRFCQTMPIGCSSYGDLNFEAKTEGPVQKPKHLVYMQKFLKYPYDYIPDWPAK